MSGVKDVHVSITLNSFKNWMSKKEFRDGWVILSIIILPILYFSRILFTNTVIPNGDWSQIFYPTRDLAREQLLKGHFPLWNPYEFMGCPLFATWQVGVLYPFNLIFLPLSPVMAMKCVSCLNIIVAGLGMYLFARKIISFPPFSALVSSILFMFGGYFPVHYEHINHVSVGVWIPLLLYCAHRSILDPDNHCVSLKSFLGYGILAGMILTIQVFAGHPQILFYSLLILCLYYLTLISYALIHKNKTIFSRVFFSGVLIFVIGLGLSAIQWIPSRELFSLSVRTTMDTYESYGTLYSLEPRHLLTFILPHVFGDTSGYFWGEGNFTETTGYLGVLPIFLLVLSFAYIRNSLSQKQGYSFTLPYFIYLFLIVTGIISLSLCVGKYNPLYPLAYWIIFPLHDFRCPSRFLLVLSFTLSLLAGFGSTFLTEIFQRKNDTKSWMNWIHGTSLFLIIPTLFALFDISQRPTFSINAFLSLYQYDMGILISIILIFYIILYLTIHKKIWSNVGLGICLFIILLDLFLFSLTLPFHNLTERTVLQKPYPTVLAMKSSHEPFRMARNLKDLVGGDLYSTINHFNRLQSNLNILYRIADLWGYPEGLIPIQNYYDALYKFQDQLFSSHPNAQLLGMMNVKYYLSDDSVSSPGFTFLSEGGTVLIYQNNFCLPMVYWKSKAVAADNDVEILKEMSKPSFSVESPLFLNKTKSLDYVLNHFTKPSLNMKTQDIQIHNLSPTQFEVNTRTPQDGFLVFSITPYLGWNCFLDNQQVPTYRANILFNAIFLPEGTHHITYQFQSDSFRKGLLISVITLGLVIFTSLYLFIRKESMIE